MPIPDITMEARLTEILSAAEVKFSDEDLLAIQDILDEIAIRDDRYPAARIASSANYDQRGQAAPPLLFIVRTSGRQHRLELTLGERNTKRGVSSRIKDRGRNG